MYPFPFKKWPSMADLWVKIGKNDKECIGCDDPYNNQDDGICFCNECSMGENDDECLLFRKDNKLKVIYK